MLLEISGTMKNEKYYILEESGASIETGNYYPQISKMASGYNYDAPNSVHAVSKYYNKIPDFIPNFNAFVVNGKSKITDTLSSSVMGKKGFILSNKAKKIIEKLVLPEHKFFDIKLNYRKTLIEDFSWLHLICDLTQQIDYSKSIFEILDISDKIIERVQLNDKEAHDNFKNTIKQSNKEKDVYTYLNAKKIVLLEKPKYDIFRIGGASDTDFYISETVKEIFEKEEITGFSFTSTSKIEIEE